jgi:hypothetical protein
MSYLYSGQLTVEVPNLVAVPDLDIEAVYQLFRARLETFAHENDALVRADFARLGHDSKTVTVDFE